MVRVGFVHVPHFYVQALLRADPELAGVPLVVSDGTDANVPLVLDVSAAAARLGLRPGLTVAQARALAPEALVRARSPELERSARAALEDLAALFSPRIEQDGDAAVAFDVSDLGRLFETELELAGAIQVSARKLGFDARIGLARDKTTARVAALSREGVTVVPAGREAAFLASLPVALLGPSPDMLLTLSRWGVRAIGELASLPKGGVALRLGKEGARLAQVARGQADDPLVPRSEPLVFEEGCDLEWPIEDVEALLFVLKRVLDNLVQRLGCRSLATGELTLTLTLDRSFLDAQARAGAATDVRTVPVGSPTREVQTLLALVRVQLESARPVAPVTALRVRATAERTRAAQLGLFEPAGPSPDKLATLLARLSALVGSDRVGAPALVDRHLPDAFAVHPFNPPKHVAEGRGNGIRQLALHAFRPARPAEARLDRGLLRTLHSDGCGGQVIAQAGPFRVRDGWWREPITRDYFDVELSDGAIYRIFHDLHADTWHFAGCYE